MRVQVTTHLPNVQSLTRIYLVAALSAAAFPALAQDEAKAHFAYIGPLSSLMPEGKTPGSVSAGLPFTIVLKDGGRTVAGGSYDLKIPGADMPLKLTLANLKCDGGHVTAQAKVENGTGSAVEGVRLDISGAIETYKAKDDQGKEVLKTRPQKVAIASPLHFGDIANSQDNGELALDASAVTFAPETTEIAVNGIVSGLRYERALDLPDVATNGQIDVDAKGRVYVSSTAGNQVARIDNDGKNLAVAAKLPDQCKGMAVNRLTGDIAATCGNNGKVFIFAAGGDDKGTIAEAQGLDNYPSWMRYDSKGTLWGTVTSGPWHFGADGKPIEKVLKAGDYDINSDSPFDVVSDGTIYVVSDQTLHRISPDRKTARRIAVGPGTKLGQLNAPIACRVDPNGNVYVTENDSESCSSRISVFDRQGNFVRVFGRGARTPAPGFPDEYHAAQVLAPSDVAFGPDGRVYVNTARKADGACHVFVFQPF